ncbi:hypothetical protein WMY93_014027 [Mugilogobius chulae]|uniref:ribonuclease H n=1 Tax=Mugilogobius chulae TaxID=88201 RepID=A0AAW0P3C4_9GOBI
MEMAAKEAQQLSASTQVHKMFTQPKKEAGTSQVCYRCGKPGHQSNECWCKDLDCRNCGKKGHIERACRNKKMQTSKQQKVKKKAGFHKKKHVNKMELEHEDASSDSDEVHVLSIRDEDDDGYWVTPLLEKKPVRMQIDTGTRVSLVSEVLYKEKLQHLPLKETKLKLRTYTGGHVQVLGVVDVTVEHNNQKQVLPLHIVSGNRPALLGRKWLKKLKLNWQEVFMVVDKETSPLNEILKRYPKVFDGELGSMKDITVKLAVKPDSTPKCLKARPVPYAIKPKVEAEIDRLVKSGVLEPVSTSEWATPIVPVMKKDGSPRICGDFKVTVNPVLTTEQYPLPLIDDLFSGLAGGQKFSKIDLSQAYLQMHVEPKSQELLTIVTHKGLYRHKRLPFGITSAPALFQRAMDQILSGLSGVQCYLDDLLITGPDEQTHLRNLDETLKRLENYGLKVRKDKCEFFQPSVEYLGHVIDSRGLHKAPSKVKAIVDAPSPTNVSQLRSFLGLLTYYARFVPNLANRLKPLHELLNKATKWRWTEKCENAFKEVKLALSKSEALAHFDPQLPIQLACDASPYGVGAVVSHIMPSGEERPIAFASRTLSKAESNYAQIEREALSIVFGVKKFHQYLYGRKFTLLTDHRPLTSIFGPHTGIPSMAASRMQRWALLLSAHQYEISKWPEVAIMKNTSSEKTIEELRSMFSRYGLPQQLVSDNGPQLVSEEFETFMVENGIQHIKSAPYHPATNGLAERFVQTMKHALKSSSSSQSLNRRLNAFLLSYRNTPHATTKVSPASAMFKRQLRNRFDLLRLQNTKDTVRLQQKAQMDRRAKAKFRRFDTGDKVLARNYTSGLKWKPATVVAKTGPVSYTVETNDHLIWKRHVDQLLDSTASRDDTRHVPPTVPELELCQEPPSSTEEPQKQSENIDSVPGTPKPKQSPTPETVSSPKLLQASPKVTVHTYPKRDRRPPDRLSL